MALYHALAKQIGVRDDAALLTRIDQMRTLLRDEDALTLIQQKPRLFANMLGNTESLLVLRFPGQPPLIDQSRRASGASHYAGRRRSAVNSAIGPPSAGDGRHAVYCRRRVNTNAMAAARLKSSPVA